MNIDDIQDKDLQIPEADFFPRIFEMQKALIQKYTPIEQRNGFYHPDLASIPHFDDPQFQHWIKDFFWRITEELAEASEIEFASKIHLQSWRKRWDTHPDVRHFFEEISDALHFMVEVSIFCGIDPHKEVEPLFTQACLNSLQTPVPINPPVLENALWDIVYQLGLAANCLKNKPWKNTHMATDVPKFHQRLVHAWGDMAYIFSLTLFGDMREIFLLYAKKNAVNQFRQTSNY